MNKPNMNCGECPCWLAFCESETTDEQNRAILEHCKICSPVPPTLYLRHIPTQSCYPLEEDGKTIIICGVHMTPQVDGKIFWEYTDEYTEKNYCAIRPICES